MKSRIVNPIEIIQLITDSPCAYALVDVGTIIRCMTMWNKKQPLGIQLLQSTRHLAGNFHKLAPVLTGTC